MPSSRSKRLIRAITIATLIGIPVAFAMVPVDQVSAGPTLCLHKRFTGNDCMGCGMTRAFSALLHGDLWRAWDFNRGVIVVAPLIAWLWFRELLRHVRAWRHESTGESEKSRAPLTP